MTRFVIAVAIGADRYHTENGRKPHTACTKVVGMAYANRQRGEGGGGAAGVNEILFSPLSTVSWSLSP
jgi:hypothetical protein